MSLMPPTLHPCPVYAQSLVNREVNGRPAVALGQMPPASRLELHHLRWHGRVPEHGGHTLAPVRAFGPMPAAPSPGLPFAAASADRKSTRLNSSHIMISYAVFCLKKKKKQDLHASTTNEQQTHVQVILSS